MILVPEGGFVLLLTVTLADARPHISVSNVREHHVFVSATCIRDV